MRTSKFNHKSNLRAKLTFDEGFRETPVYNIKAFTTEKEKGIVMLELIEDHFKITKEDRAKSYKLKIESFKVDPNKISWTRDSEGRIISPFKR